MESLDNQIVVSIRCLTYNHAPYIRQCLDGFVMQKTNFRFEAIVHDDASTDGTQDIIREYEKKYPDIIKPIYQKENQYSKGIPGFITNLVSSKCKGKYIAMCEGDDYWTDPYKLQKQVDYLETHPGCTMVCNRTRRYSEKENRYLSDSFCLEEDGCLKVENVIRKGGLYISTCSIMYRKELREDYPDYCKKCHVGDYPLQIMAAMKGSVYYINDSMSVYRVHTSQSWTSRNQVQKKLSIQRMQGIQSEVNMLFSFANDYPNYKGIFYSRMAFYIFSHLRILNTKDRKDLFLCLKPFCMKLPLLWRLLITSFTYNIPVMRSFIYRLLAKEIRSFYIV